MPRRCFGRLLTVALVLQILVISALPTAASASRATRADRDHDGLTNRFERHRSHTSLRRRDTDRDRLSDGYEVRHSHTNPRRRDTDRDGLSDGTEVLRLHTNPTKWDTDGDEVGDHEEVLLGSSPLDTADPARVSGRPVDSTPPDTTITSAPSGTVGSASASFSFSGSDNATRASKLKYECRLDGGAWGACLSPKAYSGLADGPHTFDARAKDAVGNVDPTPASRTWTIDTLDALFTYSPGAPFTGDQVTFDATASKCMASPCQYQWVDVGSDGPGGTDWPLGSGKTLGYTFSQPGTKHARLTVTDARGASSSVEQDVVVSQSLDTIAPETTITATPPATTPSASASFSFTSTEAGSTFECQLDAGAWVSCASPKAYAGLSAGGHTFSVRATDAAGNVDPAPASFAWTIESADTTPPDTSISTGPSGTVGSASASLSFTSTEAGSTFECRLDAGSWGACSSPKAYSPLADGSHTFEVRAADAAGNVDATPASRAWTVDTTAPNTSITSGPSGTVTSGDATFAFTSADAGASFECRLDSGAWGACSLSKSYSGLSTGAHSFDVRAKDTVGNVDPTPASRAWTIAAPVAAAFTFSPSAPQTGQDVTLDAGGSTCGVGPCQYQWTDISDDGPGGTDWPLGTGQSFHFTFQYPGVKYVQLTVTDAGGATDTVEHDVTVTAAPVPDTTPPDTSITASPPASATSTSASFSFAGTDNVGVSGYECQMDGGSWAACSSPKVYSGMAVGSHSFRVRAKDAAGNVDASPASYSWSVTSAADTTPPDTWISSGLSGTVTSSDASFGFSSTESGSTFECRLDAGSWGACSSPKAYASLADGSHTFDVRARDAAGNVDASPASQTWAVSTGGGGGGGGGACTQTLSVGANVASAVAGAASGSTICLGNGDYGTVSLWNIARSGFVTLRSASGRGAVLKPSVGNADYIRLDSLTLHDGLVNSCSTNVQFTNSTFQPDRSGLYVDGSACPSTTHNVLVDNVTFANVDLAGFEGRLSFRDMNGVTVKNSFFGNGGYGDGIQTGGNNRNLTIGPGNVFDGITQAFCDANGGAHCDAIQLQGGGATAITGNYFKNGDTYIMAPDGSSNVTTTNNVFDGTGRGYEYKIQFGSAANPVFRHNTVINTSAAFDSKSGMPATTGAQVKDNVWAKGYGQIKTSNGSGCSGCTFSYNLFDNSANARGTNNVIGTPSFMGGTTPTSYTGWRLTSTSPGKNIASDSTDIGIP